MSGSRFGFAGFRVGPEQYQCVAESTQVQPDEVDEGVPEVPEEAAEEAAEVSGKGAKEFA